jgi:hypothetical protein
VSAEEKMTTHDEATAEPDNPKVMMIVVATSATIALVIGIVIGVNAFWEQTVRDEVEARVTGPVDGRLKALRLEEKQKLTNYAWIDKKAGVARLPLDRAVDLTLRDWKARPEGTVMPSVAPAPAAPGAPPAPGTPAVAPATGTAPAAPAPAVPTAPTAPATTAPKTK